MSCIFTGCKIRLAHESRVYSSDCHGVGESLVFVLANEALPYEAVPDIVVDVENNHNSWQRGNIIVAAPAALSEFSEEMDKRLDQHFEAWFASIPHDEIVELDRYEPDFHKKCEACGNSPTVTGVKDEKVVLDLGLCGPCTWGEAAMLDPHNWN